MSAEPENQALSVGATIEEFRIVRILGTGSFGVVYQCDNTYLDETVAIKEFLPTDLAKRLPDGRIVPLSAATTEAFAWALDRFLQEAKTLWGLGRPVPHRNIVRVTRYRELNGSAYMFMEFERGQPLSAVLEERGTLSLQELAPILESLLDGLERVHSSGIVHRDIKPANILIRSDGSPVLIDFGAARYVAKSGERSVFSTYTPLYAALEQHQDIGEHGPWTDIYGMGATLYRAVTGHPPKSASQRLLADPQSPAAELAGAGYPEGFLRAIDWACALDPSKRPQSIAQWRDELLGGVARGAYAPTVFKPADRRHPPGYEPLGGPGPAAEPSASLSARTDGRYPSSSEKHRETGRRPFGKGLIAFTGVALLLMLAAVGWYLWQAPAPEGQAPAPDIALPPPSDYRSSTAANYERLALAHFEAGELERSIELAKLGLASTPGDPRLAALQHYLQDQLYVRRLLARAQRAAEDTDFDQSLSLIDDGLQQVPRHPDLVAMRERVQQQRGQRRQEQAQALLEQAEAARARGELDASLALMDEGLRLDPDQTELRALRSSVRAQMQRNSKVAAAITEARARLEQGAIDEGLRAVAEAMALDADNPQLFALRDELLDRRRQEQEAWAASLLERAAAARERGDLQTALELIDSGLATLPDHPRLNAQRTTVTEALDERRADELLARAQDARQRGDRYESLEIIDEGLAISPGHSALQSLRTAVEAELERRGEVERAVAEARALRRNQSLEASLARIDAALQRLPGDPQLLEMRRSVEQERRQRQAEQERQTAKLLEKARQHEAAGGLELALKAVEQALEQAPDDSEATDYRKRLRKRLQERQQTSELVANCRLVYEDAGRDLARLSAAAECFANALERDPAPSEADEALTAISDTYAEIAAASLGTNDSEHAEDAVAALRALRPEHARLAQLERELDAARRGLVPTMVAVPAGCYRMGSAADEPGREQDERPHEVCVEPFRLGRHEVTVEEFGQFVEAVDYRTDAERGVGGQYGCWAFDRDNGKAWGYQKWAFWRTPNKYQRSRPDHPVACVSWNDARAYAEWLSRETGRRFRLPTEAEWEYAARAGSVSARYWGKGSGQLACRNASVADAGHGWSDGFPCDDGHEWVARIEGFAPNAWDLYDMLGNVWEWTCSEYDVNYGGAEARCGSDASDDPRVLRGGAWNSGPAAVRSAYRNRNFPEARYSFVGFRLLQVDAGPDSSGAGAGPSRGGDG